MGGVAPGPPSWKSVYAITVDGWNHKIEAAADIGHRSIVLLSTLHRLRDDLPPHHPFRHLIGTKICHLDSVDLGQAIAEVDRVLKPSSNWWFWKTYRPTVRVIHPRGGRNRHEIGFVIADPAEQKKLLALFREALAFLERLN